MMPYNIVLMLRKKGSNLRTQNILYVIRLNIIHNLAYNYARMHNHDLSYARYINCNKRFIDTCKIIIRSTHAYRDK
jgi:hypothetical protein